MIQNDYEESEGFSVGGSALLQKHFSKKKINYVQNEVTQVYCQQHHMVSDIYVPTRVDNSAMFFTSSQYMVLR